MAYLYAAESVRLTTDSESSNPITDLWCLSNGKVLPHPSSWRGWKARPWRQRLSGIYLKPSTADRIVGSWIASLQASRASPGAQPANGAAPMTADGSGTKSPESLPSLNREQSFLKMSKGSAVQEVSLASLPTLPRSGTMRHGTVSAQPESEPRTGAAGSTWSRGEYPTPSAQEYGSAQNEGKVEHKRPTRGTPSLSTWARTIWPTPLSNDHKTGSDRPTTDTKAGMNLRDMTRTIWPTAMTTDYKASGSRCKGSATKGHPGTSLTDAVCRSGRPHPTTCQHGGPCLWSLNPLFVAWLMGLPPIGVNGSTQSATLSSRWLRRMRTELCRLG